MYCGWLLSCPYNIINAGSGAQLELFQSSGGFLELAHFDKHFVKNTRKKIPTGKIFELFPIDTLKATFRMENLGHFFRFSKKGREGLNLVAGLRLEE